MARVTNLPAVVEAGPLLPWLLATLAPPMSRTRVKELLSRGAVSVNGRATTRHDHPLNAGDRVCLGAPAPTDRSRIVHEDGDLVVLDKPAGLLTVATDSEKTDTAFVRLSADLAARRGGRPFVVHRLDRETSGLLLFAKSAAVRDALQAGWAEVEKTYLAVVRGRPPLDAGTVENHLVEGRDLRVRVAAATDPAAKSAVSRYRVVRSNGTYALVEVDLVTGRKHQIRVHLCGLGCPVVGDPVYGRADDPAGRLGLHAARLRLSHPTTGERVAVESPLPEVLRRVVG